MMSCKGSGERDGWSCLRGHCCVVCCSVAKRLARAGSLEAAAGGGIGRKW